MNSYPVRFEATPPERWDRTQLPVRFAIVVWLGFVHIPLGSFLCALYLFLPVVAAVLISQRGAGGYLASSAKPVVSTLRWWNEFVAFLFLLSDRFPGDERNLGVRFEVSPEGAPSVGKALLRLLTSLPELLVLTVLTSFGGFVWLGAAASILIDQRVPSFAWRYLHFVVALQARFLAYHASLTEMYPPLGASAPHGAHSESPARGYGMCTWTHARRSR